jgi:hypothetical protein
MGNRGGVRVIYYYSPKFERALLIVGYAKNVQEDLTNEQKKQVRKLVEDFEESLTW